MGSRANTFTVLVDDNDSSAERSLEGRCARIPCAGENASAHKDLVGVILVMYDRTTYSIVIEKSKNATPPPLRRASGTGIRIKWPHLAAFPLRRTSRKSATHLLLVSRESFAAKVNPCYVKFSIKCSPPIARSRLMGRISVCSSKKIQM